MLIYYAGVRNFSGSLIELLGNMFHLFVQQSVDIDTIEWKFNEISMLTKIYFIITKSNLSTTHCIVGAMVGFGLVYGGVNAVFWSSLARVSSSWLISPLMGAAVSFLVYKCIRRVSTILTLLATW